MLEPLSGTITRQALGRFAKLGDLYDARKDHFCGRNLFLNNINRESIYVHKNDHVKIDIICDERKSRKMDKLNIEGELQISILGEFIPPPSGHAKYLSDKEITEKECSSTLIYKRYTQTEQVNIDHKSNEFNIDVVKAQPSATHVVIGIEYGAIATMTLSVVYDKEEDANKRCGQIQFELEKMMIKLGKVSTKYEPETINETSWRNFKIEFSADTLPGQDLIPQNLEEAIMLFKDLPERLDIHHGGRPITYMLLPLASLHHALSIADMDNRLVTSLDNYLLNKIIKLFDDLEATKVKLINLRIDLERHVKYIPQIILKTIADHIASFEHNENCLRSKFRQIIQEIRSGINKHQQLSKLIEEYYKGSYSSMETENFIAQFSEIFNKIQFFTKMQTVGALLIGKSDSLNLIRDECKLEKAYVFFCYWNAQDNALNKNRELFKTLFTETSTAKIIIDCDINAEISRVESVPSGNRICLWAHHQYIDFDVHDQMQNEKRCMIKTNLQHEFVERKPIKRVELEICCPSRHCTSKVHTWHCYICLKKISYGFDQTFYCNCGKVMAGSCVYRCNDKKHGLEFISFDESRLINALNGIKPRKEVNILVIGETGVGKSTWINSIVNFISYPSLYEAEHFGLISPIPFQFGFTDEQNQYQIVKSDDDNFINFSEVESDTQDPKSYVFIMGKQIIRIIDTPGIGDIRGLDQDQINCEKILRYISNLDEIHGICVLLKSDEHRVTKSMQYCMSTLLQQLHKDAAENMMFCFTYSRCTQYRPGSTVQSLRTALLDISLKNGTEVHLVNHTMYCFDNEAFRYLASKKHGLEYGEERKTIEKSWTHSNKETKRLIDYVFSLKPHKTKDTISLNEAKQIILALNKPLVDITENIEANISAIEANLEHVKNSDQSLEFLKKQLYIPQIDIVTVPLQHGRTVCTSDTCVDQKLITNEVVYEKICHANCNDVPFTLSNKVPNTALKKCWALRWFWFWTQNCKVCGCPWDKHMHITFEQKKEKKEIMDPKIYQELQTANNDIAAKLLFVEECNKKVAQYRQEEEEILGICSKFASFLKENTIISYNDAFEDYLKVTIEEIEKAQHYDVERFQKFSAMLERYKKEKEILRKNLEHEHIQHRITADDVFKERERLFNLKLNGPAIHNLYLETLRGELKNFSYSEVYINYPEIDMSNLSIPDDSLYKMFREASISND